MPTNMLSALAAPALFDGEHRRGPHLIFFRNGVIESVEPMPRTLPDDAVRLADDVLLAPGLIDIQVNGGGGAFLNAAPTLETIRTTARAHRRFGTTGLLPTLITDAPEKMRALADVAQDALNIPGVVGFHLEGPFLNPARKGIHPPQHIRAPDNDDLEILRRFANHGRTLLTLAPEITGCDFIRDSRAMGLQIALGHSDATAEEAENACAAGATGVTHLFNAMSQIMPRAPGLAGTTLASGDIFAGIICDGLHVDPRNLRIAYKALGRDRLMIVTDAMPTAASAMTEFFIGETRIILNNGKLTGPDGTLAGAHITMIESVKNVVAMMDCALDDALAMASRTPAHFIGLEKSHGRIAPGYRADMIAFTQDFRVTDSWIGGARERYNQS